MEQDVDTGYRAVCSACLSSDRDLFDLNNSPQIYQVFRLLMYDFAGDRFGDSIPEIGQLVCWECLALMKKFHKFKWQVHSAQEHLRVLALSRSQESMDHTYMSQSLSCLEMETKVEYDKIFFDYSSAPEDQGYILTSHPNDVKSEHYDVAQVVRDNKILDIDDHILEVPEIVLENPVTGVMSHIVVGTDALVSSEPMTHNIQNTIPVPHLTIGPLTTSKIETVIMCQNTKPKVEKPVAKLGYITEYMSETDMLACREEAKLKIQYASSVYKCELCIVGFYTQQQVEDHFVSLHRAKPGQVACKLCYIYIEESKLSAHTDSHYLRYNCKMCAHSEMSSKLIRQHVSAHMTKQTNNTSIKIGDVRTNKSKKKKDKEKEPNATPPKPGDLRKLLSKTSIEVYQCLECDMFFKNSRARKNHVARFHREGLQCDHCKKRFVNRTTLATHLKLHEGPLPRAECNICHKMVRVIQLKYHVQRHQNMSRYECEECNKTFSHLATYQAHLKYSRAHASDQVFKFPCPMCNKGYPTKEAMQDHFNYQHLGKTVHKCPVCEKPIASRANVEKHMMRVHGQKKEKPRNHVCQECGKGFTLKQYHGGVCWECWSSLAKFYRFKHRAKVAQETLSQRTQHSNIKPLTTLTSRTKILYDYQYTYSFDPLTNPNTKLKAEPETIKQENIDQSVDNIDNNSDFDEKKTDFDEDIENVYGDFPETKYDDFLKRKQEFIDPSDDSIDNSTRLSDITENIDNLVDMVETKHNVNFLRKPNCTQCVDEVKINFAEVIFSETDENFTRNVYVTSTENKPNKNILKTKTKRDIVRDTKEFQEKFVRVVLSEEEMVRVREEKRNHHNFKKIPFKCDSCVLGFTREDTYILHLKKKHDESIGDQVCDICCIRFRHELALNNHKTKHYAVYRCRLCKYEAHEVIPAMNHCKTKHVGDKPDRIHCPQCNIVVKTPDDLEAHMQTEHTLFCDCGIKFKDKSNLRRHISRAHSVHRNLICDICKKTFKTKTRLETHMVTHSRNIALKLAYCQQCNIQYKNIQVYRNHLKSSANHSEGYPCTECNKKFRSKGYLKQHFDFYHLRKSQYTCEICNKIFISNWRLRNHMQQHHGLSRPRNHCCNTCGKKFFTLATLRSHQFTHSDQRSFMCEDCGDTFKQRAALYTHTRLVHKGGGSRKKRDC